MFRLSLTNCFHLLTLFAPNRPTHSHILQCTNCPEEVKQALRSKTRSTKGAKEKWALSAEKKGLFTAPKGGRTKNKTGMFLLTGAGNVPAAASGQLKTIDSPALPVAAGIPPAPPAPAATPGCLSSCRADAGSPGLLAFVDALSKGTAKGDLLEDLVNSPFAGANETADLRTSGTLPGPALIGDDMDIDNGIKTNDFDVNDFDINHFDDGTIHPPSSFPSTNDDGTISPEDQEFFNFALEVSTILSAPPPGPRPAQVTPENCPASAGTFDLDMDLFDVMM